MDLSNLTIEATPQRNWSDYQLAIFSALQGAENLIIEAVAGSGKTSTILECMNRTQDRALFLAFNKAIADDLKARVRGAEVRTLNALGHSIMTKRLPGVKLESWKTSNLLRSKMNTEDYAAFGPHVTRLISLAKGSAFGIINDATRPHFMSLAMDMELDVPFDLLPRATAIAATCFQELINDFTSLDFDDQLFLPVYHDWAFPSFDTVFVDEAQDLNPIQHLMLERLAQRGARIIAVGDTNQAIYGFRGALHTSMSILKEHFKMTELPLSITYRCDYRIVEQAQAIVPHILPRPNAGVGEIEWVDVLAPASIPPSALVVCRNNAPIFGLAMRALCDRVPVRVLSNFTEQLKTFVKSFKTRDLKILETRLDKWYEAEMKLAEDAGYASRMAYISDKYECVQSLIHESEQLDDILSALERFGNSTSGPTLCTVHKAKGLEADHCIILERNRIPSSYARSPSALQQESNLLYVAITRAKHILTYHGA